MLMAKVECRMEKSACCVELGKVLRVGYHEVWIVGIRSWEVSWYGVMGGTGRV